MPTYLAPDARAGKIKTIKVTLGNAGVVTTIAIPMWARGFRLYPAADCRFAINEDPALEATSSAQSVAESALAAGGYAKSGSWEVRLLENNKSRSLRLRSTSNAAVVEVELF